MGVFNTLYSIIGDFSGKSFLDVFGGSGIMGLEALSRGFEKVKVFELNKKSADVIKKNYNMLGIIPDLTIGDSIKLAPKLEEIFDVAYVDPPYKSDLYIDIIKNINAKIIIAESSDIIEFDNCNIIKQKTYGSSLISYITKTKM